MKNEIIGQYDQWSMVVIYDPKTGTIIHSHQAVTTRGGVHPDQAALEQDAAFHLSRKRSISADGLAFLKVDPREIELDTQYAVDLKSRSLKVVPRATK